MFAAQQRPIVDWFFGTYYCAKLSHTFSKGYGRYLVGEFVVVKQAYGEGHVGTPVKIDCSIAMSQTIVDQLRTRKSALTVAELAEILSMGTRTIYAGVKAGRTSSIQIMGTVRLDLCNIANS